MRTTIKAKVHLLITDNNNPMQVSIMRLPQKNKLYSHAAGGEFRKGLQMGHQPQHLYFTTDEEIKEGDFAFREEFGGIMIFKVGSTNTAAFIERPILLGAEGVRREVCRKIVATTNSELWKNKWTSGEYEPSTPFQSITQGIPKIDIPFIEAYIKAYNEGNPITEVLLEQMCLTCENKGTIHNGLFDVDCPNCYYKNHNKQLNFKLKLNGSVIIHPVKEKMYTREEFRKAVRDAWIHSNGFVKFEDWFNKNYPE